MFIYLTVPKQNENEATHPDWPYAGTLKPNACI